ncbi:MAG TPA: hypothetical protein VG826_17075 [Pirellulales bacterium]|nr:hypothetical protein [Pirellulales bacterium]
MACPFCTAPRPTLAQQIERADMALMGDVVAADGSTWKLRVQQSVKPGEEAAGRLIEIANRSTDGNPTPGELLLATATKRDKPSAEVSWSIVVLNEASFAYVARSPTTRDATAKRLSYFLPFLEHADPVIAEDAYLEFAHAPLDEIGKLADRLPVDRLRDWLADADLPPERKGLYGLLLGLSASAQGRADIADDFWGWITAPASDFRSGFDGVLGGYLWMGRQEALARLEDRYLGDPPGAFGDLRHLQTAMRVYHDYGRDVALEEFMRGYRRFLDHPAVAALAVADLSRWQDWQSVDRVASIFGQPGYDDPVTDRAIIGYLLACPLPEARRRVVRLRKLLPDRVTAAERTATTTSGGK